MYVLKEPETYTFDKLGHKGKIFPTNNLTTKIQYFLVETDKRLTSSLIEHRSDFIYYILKGEGWFVIDDKKEMCHKGDLVVVPAGKKFTYQGNLQMLATSTPPWEEDQEELIQ